MSVKQWAAISDAKSRCFDVIACICSDDNSAIEAKPEQIMGAIEICNRNIASIKVNPVHRCADCKYGKTMYYSLWTGNRYCGAEDIGSKDVAYHSCSEYSRLWWKFWR